MSDLLVPSLDHLKQAYAVTSRATQITPLLESTALARETGAARVFIKPESLQWAGSFKVRGAYWRLKQLSVDEAKKGVVAYSSGNFAQGLAAAGQALGVPVTIVMPIDAPAAKRDATAGYGARVVLTDHGERAREEVAAAKAREIAETEGLALLHPFDDPEIVAGQAGAGLEALDQLEAKGASADLLFCSVGGGGLIGGVSLAFHYLSPATEIIGVEPEGFNGMGSSLAHGAIETMPIGPKSICDGLMSRRPGDAPFAAVKTAGVHGITVDDQSVRRAMRIAFERMKLVLEPSGAASIAALLGGKVDVKDKTVLVVATGGNVSLADFMAHMNHA
ncbi:MULTISPECIES: threonine/serine dehydratase [Mesorhizobium]|uniref:Threonine/serine dehydratase n=4 Tax=Mesorhizobium TaxID=68287 RepID=A0AB38T7M7_9HYPH|nr:MULTISPECIES: threonine/serine dehydratase [Mesorhizobium]MDF3216069.1 threonine/serine dehydratase [Mesorhizobium ciceri]RUX74718.1 threonine/serine dehydratase [Mesorhizobium sp. M7A.F.Ca.US.005.03.1.1]RUY23263.1 threonine/serine dehydratase [Mesorhizobium sp. M7A.F.Ca.US.001.04.2.1]RUY46368.1 threonine/serine dehydratase [Mesorhizobium sp. M7A.F.Ca.US.001.04.1.1]RUY62054.1 threonine/serine dehydratase [Mesorhizobium sp. M7A.F.Ca.CA.001.13.1.1]